MDITKLDIKELKELAYDLIVESNRVNQNLSAVNKQIEVLLATPIEEVKEEEIIN